VPVPVTVPVPVPAADKKDLSHLPAAERLRREAEIQSGVDVAERRERFAAGGESLVTFQTAVH